MAKLVYKNGQTSIIQRVKLRDSASASGAGKTALTFSSSGLIISTIADNEASATAYTAAGSTVETITTLGTFAAPTATKCRFKEVDSTNHPGLYEIQIADARWAVSNAKSVMITVQCTGVIQNDSEVQLCSDDPYVAKPTNSNLFSIDSNGRVDVIKIAGTTQTARDIGASVLLSSGTGTGQISLSAGVAQSDVAKWKGTTAATVDTAGYPVVTVKSGNGAGEIYFPTGDGTVAAYLTEIASGTIKSTSFLAGAINSTVIATDAIGAAELAADAVAEIVTGVLTTQMTESYNADGTAPTLAQVLFLISQMLTEFAISGTTLTVKKLNGTTTAATFTLDSATSPTSITRAS